MKVFEHSKSLEELNVGQCKILTGKKCRGNFFAYLFMTKFSLTSFSLR
jgi:hypothetical protein